MERRKAIKLVAGTLVAGGAGALGIAALCKPEIGASAPPVKLDCTGKKDGWEYIKIDPMEASKKAYDSYPDGSCMYGVFHSVIALLAEKVGEPFASFPTQMMIYGHGGVGGYGTVCGTLNGASALIGLFVKGKSTQNEIIKELFRIYEQSPYPNFKPQNPGLDYDPPKSVSNSVLCHASTTKWGKVSGCTIGSKNRKERCRRLTADISAQVVTLLNQYFENELIINNHSNETVNTCMTCHGKEGKLNNTSGNMNCTSCHDKSVAHKVFANPHYKFMDKRK